MINLPSSDSSQHISQALIDNIQGGVIICQIDPATTVSKTLYMSEGWAQLTGYDSEALEAIFDGNPMALIFPEDAPQAQAVYAAQIAEGRSYRLQYRIFHRDGHIMWVIDRGVVSQTSDGLLQNQSILTDITPLMESEERLRLSEARFRIAIKAANAAVFEFDFTDYHYLSLENPEVVFHADFREVIGWVDARRIASQPFALSDCLHAWYHPDDVPRLVCATEAALQVGVSQCEARVRQPDHSYLWCKLNLATMDTPTSRPVRVVGHLVDIDQQHRQTERLLLKAQSDALTGLYNKSAVQEFICKALSDAPDSHHALLILDVDNFKGVNDSLGHLFGDAVLMDVSATLKRLFTPGGILGRIGGDEFMVFLPGDLSQEVAMTRANEICHAFRHSFYGEQSSYQTTCSIGVAFSQTGDSFEALFHKADIALYRAKSMGKDQSALFEASTPSI